jgi:hypothetical protein
MDGSGWRPWEAGGLHQHPRSFVEVLVVRRTGDSEELKRPDAPIVKATSTTPLAPRARAAGGWNMRLRIAADIRET